MSDQDRKGRVNLDNLYHGAQEKVAWPQGQFGVTSFPIWSSEHGDKYEMQAMIFLNNWFPRALGVCERNPLI